MLGENPIKVPAGKKLSGGEVAQALRLAVIAELDAINLYVQLASACEDDGVKRLLLDVAKEEKTHVGEFLEALLRLDPEQARELEEGRREVEEILGER